MHEDGSEEPPQFALVDIGEAPPCSAWGPGPPGEEPQPIFHAMADGGPVREDVDTDRDPHQETGQRPPPHLQTRPEIGHLPVILAIFAIELRLLPSGCVGQSGRLGVSRVVGTVKKSSQLLRSLAIWSSS